MICAALVLFVRPHYVEGRIGLGITALLTPVALQLTSSATLPDVDYLMMLDKIYLLAYVFIIAALARVVLMSNTCMLRICAWMRSGDWPV